MFICLRYFHQTWHGTSGSPVDNEGIDLRGFRSLSRKSHREGAGLTTFRRSGEWQTSVSARFQSTHQTVPPLRYRGGHNPHGSSASSNFEATFGLWESFRVLVTVDGSSSPFAVRRKLQLAVAVILATGAKAALVDRKKSIGGPEQLSRFAWGVL